ncbi:extracellular solute-binding protein, partial [Candidatus Gracilibacteria bacterium]|nr:extracellular solute-binding protein [Candidatus Gracilibacteria bacterium]
MTRSSLTRRQMLRMLSFGAAGAALAACGTASTTTSPTAAPVGTSPTAAPAAAAATELTFLVFETPNLNAEYWDTNIKTVTDQIPGLTIRKIVSPDVDRTKYAKQLLASGQLPDIMSAVAPQELVSASALRPYDPQFLEQLTSPMYGAIDGKQYQLPIGGQAIPLVFYNKAMFEQADITAEPETWAEFTAVVDKLKAAGLTPLLHGGGKDPWSSSFTLVSLISADVLGQDPEWVQKRKQGQVSFADPAFKGALTKFKTLVDSGAFNEGGLGIDYGQLQDAFLAGEGAMYPMGTWFIAAEATADKEFEVGVFPMPTESGDVVVPVHPGGGLVISATTKNPELAQQFALLWSTDQTLLDVGVKADAIFPSVKGYSVPEWVSPLFKESYALYSTQPTAFAFAWEQGDQASIPGMVDEYHKTAQALLLGGWTACMSEGRVTQFGPTPDVYRRPVDTVTARVFSDPPMKVTVRMGLHFGTALKEHRDFFGDTVNVAARMVALAKGRQILTTSDLMAMLPAPLNQHA